MNKFINSVCVKKNLNHVTANTCTFYQVDLCMNSLTAKSEKLSKFIAAHNTVVSLFLILFIMCIQEHHPVLVIARDQSNRRGKIKIMIKHNI